MPTEPCQGHSGLAPMYHERGPRPGAHSSDTPLTQRAPALHARTVKGTQSQGTGTPHLALCPAPRESSWDGISQIFIFLSAAATRVHIRHSNPATLNR